MAKKKRKWLEIEELKDGSPNILTSFRRIKEMREKQAKEVEKGKTPRKQYACVFCGRMYTNGYRLMGHLKHCDKRKQFKNTIENGIEYVVGNKSFHVTTKRVKILRNAEAYEKSFGEKVTSGAMKPEEAERLFFAFLQGAESSCSKGTVQYRIKNLLSTSNVSTDAKTAENAEKSTITHTRNNNARVDALEEENEYNTRDNTHAGAYIEKETEKEEEKSPHPPSLS